MNNNQDDVVEIEDCTDVDEEESNADIGDKEATEVLLRNKKQRDSQGKKTTKNGTRPKSLKYEKCLFEVNTATKLKCHKTIHEQGNVNYVEMLKCDRCILLFKTAGLLRRHLKEQHGIQLNPIPDNQDGARSLSQPEGRNSESAKIKCDQ